MTETLVQRFVKDERSEERRLFQQEWSIESVTGRIRQRMDEQGVSRTELASRLGVTLPWVTQLLDGEKNKTVRTLSDVFWALGRALEFHDPSLSEVTDTSPTECVIITSESWEAITWIADGETIEFPAYNTPDLELKWAVDR